MKRKQHTGGSVIDGAEQSVLSPPESLNQHSSPLGFPLCGALQAPALSASLCITQASRPCLLTNPGPKPSSIVREILPLISPASEHTYVRESSVDCDLKGDSDVCGGFGDQKPLTSGYQEYLFGPVYSRRSFSCAFLCTKYMHFNGSIWL